MLRTLAFSCRRAQPRVARRLTVVGQRLKSGKAPDVEATMPAVSKALDTLFQRYPSLADDPNAFAKVVQGDPEMAALLQQAAEADKVDVSFDLNAPPETLDMQLKKAGLTQAQAEEMRQSMSNEQLTVAEALDSMSEDEASRFLVQHLKSADPELVEKLMARVQEPDSQDDSQETPTLHDILSSGELPSFLQQHLEEENGVDDEQALLLYSSRHASAFLSDPKLLRKPRRRKQKDEDEEDSNPQTQVQAETQAEAAKGKARDVKDGGVPVAVVEPGEVPFSLGALPERKAKQAATWEKTPRHKRITERMQDTVYEIIFKDVLAGCEGAEYFQIYETILNASRTRLTIYWHTLEKHQREDMERLLQQHTPRIRGRMTRKLNMKRTPQVVLKWTEATFADDELDVLFSQVRAKDDAALQHPRA